MWRHATFRTSVKPRVSSANEIVREPLSRSGGRVEHFPQSSRQPPDATTVVFVSFVFSVFPEKHASEGDTRGRAQWLWREVIDDTLRLARGMISEKII